MSSLKSTDLFVVQRPTNSAGATDKGTYKATAAQLSEFLNIQSAVYFKGTANFSDSTATPSNPSNGDMYVNSDATSGGAAFAWGTSVPANATVELGDQVIYSSSDSAWYVVDDGGSGGGSGTLTGVAAGDGISVDNTNPAQPEVNLLTALTSSTTVPSTRSNHSGGVDGLAVSDDVTPTTGVTSSNNPTFVVTADLLFSTNKDIQDSIADAVVGFNSVVDSNPPSRWDQTYNGTSYGGVASNVPASVSVSASGTTRNVEVALAGTTTPGVFLAPAAADVNPDSVDLTEDDGDLSKVHAVTPNLLYQYYTPRNFDLLSPLPS